MDLSPYHSTRISNVPSGHRLLEKGGKAVAKVSKRERERERGRERENDYETFLR
jgi:hypothetical protein